ncbi:hypothetical protein J2Z69_000783 [Paenibacillus shirakamiensis]|uniref:Uncharacterized protein n=1 Tax=Paenibacillus shirakamiensis TaxID=1265935 RepID=A0ABS4JDG6_9BACL|nr:hypothetical protein [Paenibacillus shirakamiensis]MBP1999764.1 hypothetical protein [Paenibacillus shirakamiensis]
MRVRKILELSIDLSDPVRETQYAIKAVLDTLPNLEDQMSMLHILKQDIESILKGAEAREQSIPESGRIKEDQ